MLEKPDVVSKFCSSSISIPGGGGGGGGGGEQLTLAEHCVRKGGGGGRIKFKIGEFPFRRRPLRPRGTARSVCCNRSSREETMATSLRTRSPWFIRFVCVCGFLLQSSNTIYCSIGVGKECGVIPLALCVLVNLSLSPIKSVTITKGFHPDVHESQRYMYNQKRCYYTQLNEAHTPRSTSLRHTR